jgi:hypothetical protein
VEVPGAWVVDGTGCADEEGVGLVDAAKVTMSE